MYSWELENELYGRNYRFDNFEDFNELVECSPQINYSLYYENANETCLDVWDKDAPWRWRCYVTNNRYF